MKQLTTTTKISFLKALVLGVLVLSAGILFFSYTHAQESEWCYELDSVTLCYPVFGEGGGGYTMTFVTNISASPTSITTGGTSTISWTTSATNSNTGDVSGETTCNISPTIGAVSSHGSGSSIVTPGSTTTYTLYCEWFHWVNYPYYYVSENQSNSTTVTVTATPPATLNPPTISGPTTGKTNTSYSFTFIAN